MCFTKLQKLISLFSLLHYLRRPSLFVSFPDHKLWPDNVFILWLLINCLISHWLLINLPARPALYKFLYNFILTPKPSLAYSSRISCGYSRYLQISWMKSFKNRLEDISGQTKDCWRYNILLIPILVVLE